MIEINNSNFAETIQNNPTVVLKVWAPWCSPCKSYAPRFEFASRQYPDVIFGEINADESPELCQSLGIKGIPITISFKNGIEHERKAGVLEEWALFDMAIEILQD